MIAGVVSLITAQLDWVKKRLESGQVLDSLDGQPPAMRLLTEDEKRYWAGYRDATQDILNSLEADGVEIGE